MLNERQKVIVIDDNYDEIAPFLKALWQKGIACIYLNGQPDNLPVKPFHGVRLLFLDIVLGTEGTSDKNKAAPVANVVKHIVGNTPSPYFIVFWTKHPDLVGDVLRYLDLAKISPTGYLCRIKPSAVNAVETTSELMKEIDTKLSELGAFEYLLAWESIVEKAAHNFSTNLFINIPSKGNQTDWSSQVTTLIGSLAKGYSGQLSNTENDIRNAFFMMTDSFRDTLRQIIKSEHLNHQTSLSGQSIGLEQLAKINSSLFIDFTPSKTISIGNVLIKQNPEVYFRETLINSIFKSNIPDDIEIIGIIITPACDLVNKKYLHNSKSCFRILYGILIPIQDNQTVGKDLKTGDAIFKLEPFWYTNKNLPYLLIFHFGSLSSVWWGQDEIPDFVFALKEHLVFDIQSKMANHANRLGNSMLQL